MTYNSGTFGYVAFALFIEKTPALSLKVEQIPPYAFILRCEKEKAKQQLSKFALIANRLFGYER